MLALSQREQIVEALLSQWEDQHDRGKELSARQLCKKHPELVDEVAAGIEALRFFEATAAASLSPTSRAARSGSLRDQLTAVLDDHFEVKKLLGFGSFGVVYHARDRQLNRSVALKLMSGSYKTARFRKEARILAQLNSPHVVAIYDSKTTTNGLVLIMQFIAGGNLRDAMNASKGGIDEDTSLRWMKDVSTGMVAATEAGIIHRDLKPPNILIDDKKRAIVADFGLAIGTSRSLAASYGGMVGTPWYMSPEQFQDSKTVDTRADIYSFGATFYHAVVGELPFCADNIFELCDKHKDEPPVPPIEKNPGLSEKIDALLMRCLAKSPKDRFQSFGEILSYLDSVGPLGRPVSPATAPPLWVYKCNSFSAAGGHWDHFFDHIGNGRWGGTHCIKNRASVKIIHERLQVGDLVLAWQTNERAALGLCRVSDLRWNGADIEIFLQVVQRFPSPVPLLRWKKKSPALEKGKAFQPANVGTLFETTAAEAREILRICNVPLHVAHHGSDFPPTTGI